MHEVKAIYTAGMQMWFSDKRSIIMRFFVWPNAIPLLFCGFMILAMSIMSMRTQAVDGDMSKAGGVTFTVLGESGHKVGELLSKMYKGFTYLKARDDKDIRSMFEAKEITFALYIQSNENDELIVKLKYDSQREYPHLHWIEQTKDKMVEIAALLRSERLSQHINEQSVLDYALVPIKIEVEGTGQANRSFLLPALTAIVWAVLLILPMDCAASITSQLMLNDKEHDFISTWKSAGVNSINVVIGRLLTGITVYSLGLIILLGVITFWTKMYLLLMGYIIPKIPKEKLMEPGTFSFTQGFVDLIEGIHFFDVILMVFVLVTLASLMIALRLRLSVYISNLEQVRTKLMLVDIILTYMPMLGFLIGVFSISYVTMLVPFINVISIVSGTLNSELAYQYVLIACITNILLTISLTLRVNKHIDKPHRLIDWH